jgi:hypothetical protein
MQTQSEIAAVLATAARAQDPRAERDVIDAAQAVWVRDGGAALPSPAEAATARRLNEQALQRILGPAQHSGGVRSFTQGFRRKSERSLRSSATLRSSICG